jgi:hypothetical protein
MIRGVLRLGGAVLQLRRAIEFHLRLVEKVLVFV